MLHSYDTSKDMVPHWYVFSSTSSPFEERGRQTVGVSTLTLNPENGITTTDNDKSASVRIITLTIKEKRGMHSPRHNI